MYNRTVVDMMLETKDDFIAFCASRSYELVGTLIFMITITWGRKCWLSFLNLLLFVHGLVAVLVPRFALHVVTEGEADLVHVQLSRCVGLLMVGSAMCYWLLQRSTDSTTATSLLWTSTLVTGCCLLAQGYVLTHPGKKSSSLKFDLQMLSHGFYMTLLMFVGCLYHATRSSDWGGFGQVATAANLHLRLDFVLLMWMGVLLYALPQWILRIVMDVDKLDTVHAYTARGCGAFLIGMATMSGRAANFLRGSDKDCVMLSHWMVYVSLTILGWCFVLASWSTHTWTQLVLRALHDLIIIVNATGALDVDVSVVRRLLLPRLRDIPADVCSVLRTPLAWCRR